MATTRSRALADGRALALLGSARSVIPATGGPRWGDTYALASLPRRLDTFRDGAFAPQEPIQPVPIDVGSPPDGRPKPRRWQYPVGWNLPVGQPGTESIKLANFQQLRDVGMVPSIPRVCIEICKQDLITLMEDGLAKHVIPTEAAALAMSGNPAKRKDFESRKAEVVEFFSNPDPDRFDGFLAWLGALVEDALVLDAMAIHIQPTAGRGNGPVGSSLGALALLDGSMIKPLVALDGARPRPPEVAWQQYVWGVPRVDLMDLLDLGPDATIDDLKDLEPAVSSLLDEAGGYTSAQLMYRVLNPRNETPYGFGPLEQGLLPASLIIARQTWQVEFFRSGSLPAVWMKFTTDSPVNTPDEARAFTDAINKMHAGDLENMWQVIPLPPGAEPADRKVIPLTDEFDTWVAGLMAMPFGLSLFDLGITPKVASLQSAQMSRASERGNQERVRARSTVPRGAKLKEGVFDWVIQRVLGQRDMEFSWGIIGEGETRDEIINQQVQMVKGAPLASIDEGRAVLELDPLNIKGVTDIPLVYTATGAIPIDQLLTTPDPLMAGQPGGPGGIGQRALPLGTHPRGGTEPGTSSPMQGAAGSATEEVHAAGERARAEGKSIGAESRLLRWHLRKGRPLAEFRTGVLPRASLAAACGHTDPNTASTAVNKAARRIGRRDAGLDPQRRSLAAVIAALAAELQAGRITAAQFQARTNEALTAAYGGAAALGAQHAADDWGGDPAPTDGVAQAQVQRQQQWLVPFTTALLGAGVVSAAQLAQRAGLWGESVLGPYEAGYGATVDDLAPEARVRWTSVGDENTCQPCADLDGQVFDTSDHPWPGAEVCDGLDRCRCELVYLTTGMPTSATIDVPVTAGALGKRAQGKDFGVGSPLASGFVPFDLPPVRRPVKDAGTLTKAEAHYTDPSPNGARACGRCSMFREPGACTLVEGAIDPDATCDHFDPRSPGKSDGAHTTYTEPEAAGVAVRAADTGRVLMLQRSLDESDPAAGKWEFAGGHLIDGETPWAGAAREWQEETGTELPPGRVVNTWDDPSGIYCGFVYEVPDEASVPINTDRSIRNPDDPDGDSPEVCAWTDPSTIPGNPAMRTEVANMDHRVLLAPDAVERLGKGAKVDSATRHVEAYLAKRYPSADLHWVRSCSWQLDQAVPLIDVQMARRPGGRDDTNVTKKLAKIRSGKMPKPVVLVRGLGPKLTIADGWTRTAALHQSGHDTTPAWIGTPAKGVDGSTLAQQLRNLQYHSLNHPGDPDGSPVPRGAAR